MNVAGLLANLSFRNDNNRAKVMQAGAVQTLIGYVSNQDAEGAVQSEGALRRNIMIGALLQNLTAGDKESETQYEASSKCVLTLTQVLCRRGLPFENRRLWGGADADSDRLERQAERHGALRAGGAAQPGKRRADPAAGDVM